MKEWSWVKGGIALGLLSIAAIFLTQPLGASTEYVITDGMLIKSLVPAFIQNNAYFSKFAGDLSIGYGMILVMGMAVGAIISMLTGGKKVTRDEKPVPKLWAENFGFLPKKRYIHAFAGGFLVLFGARLAGGCTNGHIISGITQLSISGFVFAAAVFLAGIPTARLIYRNIKEGN